MTSHPGLILLLLTCCTAFGQQSENDDASALLRAEEEFMALAREKNTRDAFLHYFSDEVVTANPTHGPRRGKEHLLAQQPNDSWLAWRHTFSGISASGDFGYNTGPWEFREKRSDEQPVAYGQFVSVWKKNENKEWKVVVDMGIRHPRPTHTSELMTSKANNTVSDTENLKSLFAVEKSFIAELKQGKGYAYEKYLSAEMRILRPGIEPHTTIEDVRHYIHNATDRVLKYEFIGGEMAPTKDLAYVYGRATQLKPETDGTEKTIHTYLRIWKKETDGWKIVLDLLTD